MISDNSYLWAWKLERNGTLHTHIQHGIMNTVKTWSDEWLLRLNIDKCNVVYPVPVTGSRSPGLPVPAVERDWLMRDRSQYCLFPSVLLGIVLCMYSCSLHYSNIFYMHTPLLCHCGSIYSIRVVLNALLL